MTYILPFKKRPVKIGQGFSQGSHKDWPEDSEDMTYSVDFLLPEGTELIASRSGTVVKIKDSGKKNYSGKDEKKGEDAYKNHMNYIEIKHNDGTYASYSHVKHKGSLAKVGDKIKQGQVIGYSGNTGWSSAPHLDFNIFRKNYKGRKIKTIKFKFKDYWGELELKKPKRHGGWQMWVDEYDDHVIKTPRTKEEIKEKISKHLEHTGNLHKSDEISDKLVEDFHSSMKIIKKSGLPLKYLAHPEFLENGSFKQRKVETLGTLWKEYSKKGKISEAKKLVDKFIKFTFKLWEYGIHEKPFKPTGNFGILGKDIVMIDFLELTSNKTKAQKKLHLKKDKFDRLFPKDRYDLRIKEYTQKQTKKYLTTKNINKYWKRKLR